MKWVLAVALVLAVIGVEPAEPAQNGPPCIFGRVQGFITVRSDPEYLVGTIPNKLTTSSKFFTRRYNCKGYPPSIKRVDLGVYDVRFPRLNGRTAFVSAISQEGVSASVQGFSGGIYRVALRGPLVRNDALVRRDVAFSLALF